VSALQQAQRLGELNVMMKLLTSGFVLMILAAMSFGTSDVLLKYLSSTLDTIEIAFFRFVLGIAILLPILSVRKESLWGKNTRMLFVRGLLGTTGFFCFLKAISMISLSDAIVLLYTNPLFVVLYSFLLFRESVRWSEIVLAFSGFIGIYILVDPSGSDLSMGHVFGLLSGVISGAASMVVRKLRETDGPFIIYFYVCIVGTFLSFPFLLDRFKAPVFYEILFLISIGVILLIGHLLMNQGFKFCKASEGSVILMAEVVFAGIGGALIFKDPVTTRFLAGATMIVGSGIGLNLFRHSARKP